MTHNFTNMQTPITILGIESSCDDTAASVLKDGIVLSNIISSQKIHEKFGGVLPEAASRAHTVSIVPVVELAIKEAGISTKDISAIAFTQGPGLLGSLLVGSSFAKAIGLALNIPIIGIHHMQAHILSHFIRNKPGEMEGQGRSPEFPFLCLTVSGGHTQIVLVKDYFEMEILGETQDDAAGEAFDKVAKILGMPYPGGPLVDKYAQKGDSSKFTFPTPFAEGFGFSFSGLKTAVMYKVRDGVREDPDFIVKNQFDICASVQKTIVELLLKKLFSAAEKYKIMDIAIAGGVSANSSLRKNLEAGCSERGLNSFIPPFAYCTDNAAMIAISGYYRFLKGEFSSQEISSKARLDFITPLI